jgi:CAAX protease family protein
VSLVLVRDPDPPRPVAPTWHAVPLVGLFVSLAVAGALFQHHVSSSAGPARLGGGAALYLQLIVLEWGLVLYVWKAGLRRRAVSLRALVGGCWSGPREVAIDALLGFAAWGLWIAFGRAWDRWMAPSQAASVAAMLPRSPIEIGLWLALSASVGFAEELVFRGYLQAQFHALTRRRGVALVMQAALFGVSHGYQGLQASIRIMIFGLLMGGLAVGRRSLRPGILAHAWTDIASGILRI